MYLLHSLSAKVWSNGDNNDKNYITKKKLFIYPLLIIFGNAYKLNKIKYDLQIHKSHGPDPCEGDFPPFEYATSP